jgi:hypothetical protein
MVLEKRGNDEKISHQYFKNPGKYSVIDHEKYFFKKNYPSLTKPTVTIPIANPLAIETDLL